MKHFINFSFLFLIIFLMSGCFLFGNKCKDQNYRSFTSTEENLIPYGENDSLRFVNPHTGENFIGRVSNYKFNLRDTVVNEDLYCDDQIVKVIQSRKELHLLISRESNDEILVNMKLELFTVDFSENSRFFIDFSKPYHHDYILNFNDNEESFVADHEWSIEESEFVDSITINNKVHYKVFKIYCNRETATHPKSDTIFYSLDNGLVRLVIPEDSIEFVSSN